MWHLMLVGVQAQESTLQHKVDMVSRLEHKTNQMAATIRDMEDGSVNHETSLLAVFLGCHAIRHVPAFLPRKFFEGC